MYFNSIKVRLERFRKATLRKFYTFQFHKGTIRTMLEEFGIEFPEDFNSIKVRLELG